MSINKVRFIDKIPVWLGIYEFLDKNANIIKSDANKDQVAEECEKAKHILNDEKTELRLYNGAIEEYKGKTWEEVIIEAEKYAFFKGAIRFLFRDGNEKLDENLDWKDFDTKWENAQKYFDKDGVKDYENNNYKSDCILLRYFISLFTKWGLFWKITYDNESSSWKKSLLDETWAAPIHLLLTNEVKTPTDEYKSKLEVFDKQYEDMQKKVQEDLVSTKLLCKIDDACVINWRYNNYVLYPSNARADWKKYVIANKRNEILSPLVDGTIIKCDQKIEGCNFFWGWNINFQYNNNNFQWNTDGKIYLLDADNRQKDSMGNDIKVNTTNIDKDNFTDKLNSINNIPNNNTKIS